MNLAVLGTGTVAKTIAQKLTQLGHAVKMGTRDVQATRSREKDGKFFDSMALGTFAEAAAHGELAFAALNGEGALAALRSAKAQLAGKILIDITNPLDFSKGFPPSLTVHNTDSLGEQIQRELPETKVVKSLNTVNAQLMVNPRELAGGDHSMFVAGNDAAAKAEVTKILKDWFGWKDVVDLGDIVNSRGLEMYLPLWVRLYGALQTPMFNLKLVR